ncbi:hypothetical protein FACS1894109_06510 [Spirochaetia bacterium]|nr:hypothetical protein FACS1894109_06510 [Spirochaetia bacterium]
MIGNIQKYTLNIYADFSLLWKILIAIIGVCFLVMSSTTSKQNKGIAAIVSIGTIGISFIMSAGAYLVLQKPLFGSHSMYGVGVFVAIIAIILVSYQKKYMAAIVLALNYSFFVFAFSYGNALADQQRYTNFRTEILLQDLNNLFPNRNKNEMKIQLENSVGYAPSVANIAKSYPVIKNLVPRHLAGGGVWGIYYLVNYFNWGEKEMANHNDLGSEKTFNDFATYDLPIIFDSYYYSIKSDGGRILVILKNE